VKLKYVYIYGGVFFCLSFLFHLTKFFVRFPELVILVSDYIYWIGGFVYIALLIFAILKDKTN